jgi:hypothetical protein
MIREEKELELVMLCDVINMIGRCVTSSNKIVVG